MKKRILFSVQMVLFGLFIFSLLVPLLQLSGNSNPLNRFDFRKPVYNHIEAFDPSLSRLNSLEKLEQYCDSVYTENVFAGKPVEFEKTYTDIVSSVIRNRFYHGYSYSNLSDNYLAELFSKVTVNGWSAIVIPDDILKYPFGACSQQSIVMMEVLKDKGLLTRKISFYGKKFGGHFAFEVFYDGTWHFNDPNLEPDKEVLDRYGRPGIDFLARNPEILLRAYSRFPRERILDIFPTYSYGHMNQFPASRAMIFQKTTKFLSYTIWLFFLIAFIIVRRKYLRVSAKMHVLNKKVRRQREQQEATPIFYPGYKTAPGA